MTKRIITQILLICVLFLSSCDNNDKSEDSDGDILTYDLNTDEYLEEMDDQNYFLDVHRVCKSDKGYYFSLGPFLYFFDNKIKETIKVCGLPNCKHENEYCNAYFNQVIYNTYSIWYYNGKLYMNGREENDRYSHYLYEISDDGSERKQLCFLYKSEEDFTDFSLILHRGYAYYVDNSDYDISNRSAILYRVSLEGDQKPEKVFELRGYGSSIFRIRGYGKYIYFQAGGYQDADGNGYSSGMYRMEYQSEAAELLISSIIPNDYFVTGNKIYYFRDNYQLMLKNMDTNEETIFYETTGRCSLSFDGVRIYIDNALDIFLNSGTFSDRRLDVLDLEGNIIDKILISNVRTCYYGDADYLFAQFDDKIKAFDKSQIGTTKQDWVALQ